jgi:hypothetical protein
LGVAVDAQDIQVYRTLCNLCLILVL